MKRILPVSGGCLCAFKIASLGTGWGRDLEARVLIGLRPGVQRVSVLPSGARVAPALGGWPWRSGGADVCTEALSWHHEGWFR